MNNNTGNFYQDLLAMRFEDDPVLTEQQAAIIGETFGWRPPDTNPEHVDEVQHFRTELYDVTQERDTAKASATSYRRKAEAAERSRVTLQERLVKILDYVNDGGRAKTIILDYINGDDQEPPP